jgi:PHD-finger
MSLSVEKKECVGGDTRILEGLSRKYYSTKMTPQDASDVLQNQQIDEREEELYEGEMDCICRGNNPNADDGVSLQCENCNQWQHIHCLGFQVPQEDLEEAEDSTEAKDSENVHVNARPIPATYFCPKCLRKYPALLEGHAETLGFLLALWPQKGRPSGRKSNSQASLPVGTALREDILDVDGGLDDLHPELVRAPASPAVGDPLMAMLDKHWRYVEVNRMQVSEEARAFLSGSFAEFMQIVKKGASILTMPRLIEAASTSPSPKTAYCPCSSQTYWKNCVMLPRTAVQEIARQSCDLTVVREMKIKIASDVLVQTLFDRSDVMDDKMLRFIEATSGKRFEYVRRAGCWAASTIEPNRIIAILTGSLKTHAELETCLSDTISSSNSSDNTAALNAGAPGSPIYKKLLNSSYLFFHPSLPLILDAQTCGNQFRFIRKSCRPNAVLQGIYITPPAQVGRDLQQHSAPNFAMAIMATHQIVPGTEICLPLDFDAGNRRFVSLCGCQNDVNVVSWCTDTCLMPAEVLGADLQLASPLLEKWLASQKDAPFSQNEPPYAGSEQEDALDANHRHTPLSYKERLAKAVSMRPLRYLPTSYKRLAAPPRSLSRMTPSSLRSSENNSALNNKIFKHLSSASKDRLISQPSTKRSTMLGLPASRKPSIQISPMKPTPPVSPRKKTVHKRIESSLSPPPRPARPSLTREERKLQMYIETIQRIEARESKKRKTD